MKKHFWILILILSTQIIFAQEISLTEKLPFDNKITTGTLENGLKYYIRHNEKPENRAELRLAVNAGSVLENEDQQGLAHFAEHMAFNGTKNFEKHEIIDYLESIGMRFGPDINAYTSFDETVYILQVPMDSAGMIEKGFQILKDWAYNVSFEPDEIDKERGVVIEEWRLGRGANARIRDKQFPTLFKNSVYAERLPIGKKDILENFQYETLKQFYKDWYRPDLIAVIAVGDFDTKRIEELIKENFSEIPPSQNPIERKLFPIPDHQEVLYTIATDPELTYTAVQIYFKQEVQPQDEVKDYRRNLMESLYNGMLNRRLNELSQQPQPPFLQAYSAKGRFIRSKEFYYLGAAVKEDGIKKGLETILTEAERVKQFGFTPTELERQKDEMLANIERAYKEKDKTESDNYAAEYIRNFLTDEPVPGIEFEYKLYNELLPGITLEEVNTLAKEWVTDHNMVVAVSAPEKEGLIIPDESELKSIVDEVNKKQITAYEDKFSNLPLVDNIPAPAKIVNEKEYPELGVTEWQLENGVKVFLKPTDFKNDEILFQGFSAGGTSVVPDEDYIPAITASPLVQLSGVGNFNYIELQKLLTGKVVNVNTGFGELSENISGSSTPKDVETMFQLIYLYFTSPRIDSSSYLSYIEKVRSYLKNRSLNPEAAFQDTINVTLSQYHPRREPWSEKMIDKMDMSKSLEIYKNRFADASDFTFVFVGNFKPDSIKPFIQRYIGGLHSIKREESWKDLGIEPPSGIIKKEVDKGLEPKSRVNITFSGSSDWSPENYYNLTSMTDAFRIKLREVLREDMGGTYGVGINANSLKYPDEEYAITISFGCAPERVEELTGTVFQLIDSLKNYPLDEIYLTKVKETQRRQWEVDLKENNFWLRNLWFCNFYDLDLNEFLNYPKRIDGLSLEDIQHTAQKYLDENNYVSVVLYPENKAN
jgi:zinc protease